MRFWKFKNNIHIFENGKVQASNSKLQNFTAKTNERKIPVWVWNFGDKIMEHLYFVSNQRLTNWNEYSKEILEELRTSTILSLKENIFVKIFLRKKITKFFKKLLFLFFIDFFLKKMSLKIGRKRHFGMFWELHARQKYSDFSLFFISNFKICFLLSKNFREYFFFFLDVLRINSLSIIFITYSSRRTFRFLIKEKRIIAIYWMKLFETLWIQKKNL